MNFNLLNWLLFLSCAILPLVSCWGEDLISEYEMNERKFQRPPSLDKPRIVTDYSPQWRKNITLIDGSGGDLLLIPPIKNGKKQVLKNVYLIVYNFRKLHIKGLDIEIDDPGFNESRVLLLRTSPKKTIGNEEEIFIEGLRIENNFLADNSDAIAMHFLGTNQQPLKRLVIQNSRITGIGVPGNDDGKNVHPDILHLQSKVFLKSVFIENLTSTTMYQGIFAPWDKYSKSVQHKTRWSFSNVSITSMDRSTHRLIVLQSGGLKASDFPRTTFDNVYLLQEQAHPWGVGPAEIHINPSSTGNTPYRFKSETNIHGHPFHGVPTQEFVPRNKVGIYYESPH